MFNFLHNEFQTQYRDQMLRKLHEICKFVTQCYTPCSFPPPAWPYTKLELGASVYKYFKNIFHRVIF